MKRVIVDYAKLTNEILTLLVEKFPEGYDDSNIIRFKNAKNENIEAVEVRTEDTIYLVKVSTKLADRIENYDEDDIIDEPVDDLDALKELDIADDDANDDDDVEKDADADVDTERDPDDEEDDVDADADIADEEDEDEEEY